MPSYPTGIDSFAGEIGTSGQTLGTPLLITLGQHLADAIVAIETELATDVSGTFATAKARFLDLEAKPSWIAATLLNSWVNYGSGYATAAYFKHAGLVYVKGFIKNGTNLLSALLLPAGYRPLEILSFPGVVGGFECAHVEVRPDGNVTINTPTNAFVGMNGIIFKAEQ